MWTKLRPGARRFLAAAAEKFELWIHTAGSRSYALAMAELLGAHYFGNRIIAQQDGAEEVQVLNKRLASGLEGREPVAVILDDSSAVWPHDRRNLLVAERYVWFPTARVKGRGSLLEMGRDECARGGMLCIAMGILDRLHSEVGNTADGT
ncbi:hypothetical protein MNEG_4223 [Monoraphidium neglectum]|uniref:protein-serine/threonine phosphatase n=1 Tax=Monoraphidium neglectum TaxID=145388 RepID=A0A0D2LAC3_9CHLO|nr:hypothetical protein MNEG_4223 [Monoraphidium neglectum]KIZ03734.1 hypothetical protein MNEG_4223 [Monoraphidium neglectum]|eukprot:XP_013902753.1 hypothetical protein MNEG_4223 [Monoraphidium neglectum]